MMTSIDLEDMTVSEIMRRWPVTTRLFIDRRLLCVGCPIAPFHTLTDVAREHGVDYDNLVAAVLAGANADELQPSGLEAVADENELVRGAHL
jgi:hybrid cluster-associated redox disulfide protein